MRSMKMRLPVSRRCTSSRTSRVCLNACSVLSANPSGRSALTPPTRPYEIVSRAPVTSSMELGAFTVFLYMIKAREYLWELVEDVTGARLTISYGRVGGVKADLPGGFAERAAQAFQ